jgi:hypothetical protein
MNHHSRTNTDPAEPTITGAIDERCRARLDHDLQDLARFAKTVGHGRLQMGVQSFGGRIVQIGIRFPSVRTGLREGGRNAVVVQAVEAIADVTPGAWDVPYPLGEPMVRLRFPHLPEGLEPFLSNLHFVGPGPSNGRRSRAANPMMAMLDDAFRCPDGVGVPCLWRRWHPQRDLVWLARQIHSLLVVEPSAMASPTDCLDPEAARYWVSQKDHAVPLEPPLAPAAALKRAPPDPAFVFTKSTEP